MSSLLYFSRADVFSNKYIYNASELEPFLLQLFLAPDCALLVDVLHHGEDVGGEQVVHFVAQRRLAQQLGHGRDKTPTWDPLLTYLGSPDKVADGHVEVGVTA